MLIATMTACGGLLFGYDVGVISGALLFLGKNFSLTDKGQEVVTSAVLVGSFLGALGAGWYTRRFGGRSANMLAGAIFVVGAFASAASDSAETLTMSRLLVGIGIGITAVAAPLYVAEIAPPDRRGMMITLYQLFITIGIMVSYIVDLASAPHWRVMFGLGAVPGVVLAVGMSFMPSSPRWLASRGRMAEAKKFLIAHSNLRWPRLPCAKFKPISILKKINRIGGLHFDHAPRDEPWSSPQLWRSSSNSSESTQSFIMPRVFFKSWICR